MFIGHFGVGFAAKRLAPPVSLGVLMGAALLLDLLWALFVLAGAEQVRVAPGDTAFTPLAFSYYPWSHSLAMTAAWAAAAAAGYWFFSRSPAGSATVFAAVLSHWILDAISHRPDLPLYPESATYAGLGLWNSVPATLAVEGLLFAGGVWLYTTGTRPGDKAGASALNWYVAALVVLYVGNLFGPPPPSGRAVAFADLGGFLFVLWAGWLDGRRAETRRPDPDNSHSAGKL